MKTAIICARLSSDEPDREKLDDQLAECRKCAEVNGYRVVGEVAEGAVSGGRPLAQRPDALRALEALKAGRVDAVIWREIDRMGRRFDTAETIEEYQRYGDGIIFVRQPKPDDPTGEILQRGMGAVLARWERANIYGRTARGRNRQAREGRGNLIGRLPKWLRWSDDAGYVLVEHEARRATDVLEAYERRRNVDALAIEYGITRSELRRRIITNPTVAGRRYLFPLSSKPPAKTEQQRRRRDVMREIGLAPTIEQADAIAERHGLISHRVPELISWDRFRAIQEHLLKVGGSQRGRPPKERLSLQRRVVCGRHGLAYTPTRSGSGYVYAECAARRGYGAAKHGRCDYPRFPWTRDTRRGRALVSIVSEALEEAMSSPEAVRQAVQDSLAQITAEIDQLQGQIGDAEPELEQLRGKKTKLALLWANGDLSDDTWQHEKSQLDRRIDDLERRARSIDTELRRLASLRSTREIIEAGFSLTALLGDAGLVYGGSLEETAERLDLCVTVEADRLRIEGTFPIGEVLLDDAKAATPSQRLPEAGRSESVKLVKSS